MAQNPLHGRCLCGAVAYEVLPPFLSASHCHCESCRRAHGAAFVSWATVKANTLTVTRGASRIVAYPSSPGARRSFCGTCGSQLFMHYDPEPEEAYVALGSLEDAPDPAPVRHVSFEERVGWFPFEDALPKHRGKSSDPVD